MRYLIGLLRTRLLVGAAVAAAAVLAMAGSAAGSGTYDVCPTGPPACGWTLTDAVTDAIATAGPDTLQLAPGTYLVDSVFLEGTYEPITIEGMGTTAAAVVVMSTTRDVVTERATTRPQPDTLENLTISGGAFAGIAQQNATLALQNVVVENNAGAGVSLSGGTVTISGSTISGSGRDGIDEGSALLTVTNSTISGNHGDGVVTDPSVGGIETSLRSDTIAQNHGFGLSNAMTVVNTITAGNAGGDCNRSPGIRGGPVSSGTNLSGDFSCGNFFTAGGDQVPTFPSTIDPRLGSLADNGGPTPTMALGTGSPAIDAGGVSCPGTDQRGFLRDASCDIGAYEAGAHGLPSASASTVSANPASVLADGATTSTITVTLKDAGGNPVSGDHVALSPDAGHSTISAPSGPSDANGQVTFGVSDATAETVSYSAEDADRGVFITQTSAVTFTTPGGGGPVVSATTSTVQASPASVPADGSTSSTITVTLKDGSSNPVAGKTVTVSAGGGSSAISAASGLSNPSGVVTFTVKDSSAESVTYTARDSTDAIVIAQTASVTFTAVTQAPPPPSGLGTVLSTLRVTAGTGGTVTSDPSGITCPSRCSFDFVSGTPVTLTARPSTGFGFAGWSGDCSGVEPCRVIVDRLRSVIAQFAPLAQLTVTVSGAGAVTSAPAGISCPGTCTAGFAGGSSVDLTATPAAGSVFAGWSGDCTGTKECVVAASAASHVAASFSPTAPAVSARKAEFTLPSLIATGRGQALRPHVEAPFDASPTPVPLALTIAGYSWAFADQTEVLRTQQPITQHAFAKPGSYIVTLTVTFSDGSTAKVSHGVLVAVNQPPAALAKTTGAGLPGQPISFDASKSFDPDGRIVLYEIDQNGDGVVDTTSTTPQTTVTYTAPGTYHLTLTVTDNDGARSSATYPMTVGTLALPPVIPASPQTTAKPTEGAVKSLFVAALAQQPDTSIVGCTSLSNCKSLDLLPLDSTCLQAVSKGSDLVFTGHCIQLVRRTAPTSTLHATYHLESHFGISANGISFIPPSGFSTLNLDWDGTGWTVTGNASQVTYESVVLDPGTWSSSGSGVNWDFVPKSGGGWTISCVGSGGFRSCSPHAYRIPSGAQFQGLPIVTIGWPTFRNGDASVPIATALPAALTNATPGTGTVTQQQTITLTTGFIENATAAQNQTQLPSAIAANDQASNPSITVQQMCTDAIGAKLPSGPGVQSLSFPDINMGGFELKNVNLTIDGNGDLFARAGTVKLPFLPDNTTLEGVLEIDNGHFAFGCVAADFGTPGLLITPPIYLQHAGLAVANDASGLWVHGDAGFLTGDKVPVVNEPPLRIDATATLIIPNYGAPWGFEVFGDAYVTGIHMVNADVKYWADPNNPFVEASIAAQNLTIGLFKLNNAALTFRLDGNNWDLGANADIGLIGVPSWAANVKGSIEVSNLGIGVCGTVTAIGQSVGVGATFNWGDSSPSFSVGGCSLANITPPIRTSCEDLRKLINTFHTLEHEFGSDYSSAISALQGQIDSGACVGARREAFVSASNFRVLTVAQAGAHDFIFRGNGGAPVVTLFAPDGRIFHTPLDNTARTGAGGGQGLRLPFARETIIAVAHAPKGKWLALAEPGSPAIASAATANVLPAPSVHASVSGLGGRRFALRYQVAPLPGEKVTFREVGRDSSTVIGQAVGSQGTIRFTSADGSSGTRRIIALISLKGHAFQSVTVGRYRAPRPVLLGRVSGLRIVRSGSRALVSFAPLAHAVAFEIDVRANDRRHWKELLPAAGRRLVVPLGPDPRVRITVGVAGIDAKGRAGKRVQVTGNF